MNLNKERVKQLQSGKVVLYTGDKKGSEIVIALVNDDKHLSHRTLIGTSDLNKGKLDGLTIPELNNRPIHPVEWFYEGDLAQSIIDEIMHIQVMAEQGECLMLNISDVLNILEKHKQITEI